ncbi:MAG: TldD/PmbA family protein [Thermoplasmata archaeon]
MGDLRDHEDTLGKALRVVGAHTPFVEAVAQRADGLQLRVDRTGNTVTVNPVLSGAAIRAWGGDRWLEVAASRLDPPTLDRAATALIAQLERRPKGPAAPGTPTTARLEAIHPPAHSMNELTIEDRIGLANDYRGWAAGVEGISDTNVILASGEDERLYLNSVGAYRYQVVSRAVAVVVPIAMENGRVDWESHRRGGVAGQEILKKLNEETIRTAAKSAVALLRSKTPPGGAMNVVLDPSTAGTLAHESFGHGTEADQFVRERSYLQPIFGSEVGPDMLSIVDDGSYPGGWGSIYFDDEGRPSQRNLLIDRGRFVGVLHDRTSAASLGGAPTGNARRSDFLSRLWVRMTNTLVVPGTWTKEELVREAGDGVLLETTTSGIEDPLGGLMQIKVHSGWRIEHGKTTDLLSSMALSGRVLDVLRSVKGVGRADDLEVGVGFCGKGHSDYIPAGTGGPYLLTHAVVGPA